MSSEITKPRESAITPLDLGAAFTEAAKLGPQGAEVIERLQQVQMRQDEWNARKAFNAAVAELHRRIGSIPKNRTANFKTKSGASVSYRYADLDQVATSLRQAGAGDLGLSWHWDTEYADNAEIVTCTLSHDAGHHRKATWRAPIEAGNPMTSAPQKAKIATTFAQRVTLIQVFGLTDTEDDVDGQMPSRPQADEPADTITEAQVAELRKGLEILGEGEEARFCKVAKIDLLEALPAARYAKALAAINRRVSAQEQQA